ncbi:OmpA/MotB domain-containing protein [Pseudoxanthomonas suwonensis 11-1]|uniref:OmpA/MotB domain-containing protein n=1 Tax=Pseudoxanthomonas suwonensis (strain 11-1) TaxID=743721 RepID=E6WS54_PSEUU|nr:hypothetical protein [Pseudoxanthomonas suwonensis]ADV27003.1 OmpA/MotB domain-containing protein [Pseudoxanthomonas suwonensis 11-1]
MQPQPLTQAELDRLTDEQVHALERASQRLADETQRQAAHYQRTADRMRKALKNRNRRRAEHGERA